MHFVKYIASGDGVILNYDPALQISTLYKAPSTFTNWIYFLRPVWSQHSAVFGRGGSKSHRGRSPASHKVSWWKLSKLNEIQIIWNSIISPDFSGHFSLFMLYWYLVIFWLKFSATVKVKADLPSLFKVLWDRTNGVCFTIRVQKPN